jgi:biopolymer transport protein TolR
MTVDDGSSGDDLRSEINVTPLVDVMLVLLVIFMVVTPLLRVQVPVDLPLAKQAEDANQVPDQVTLSATTDGVVRINGEIVERDALEEKLRALYATRADKVLFLEADRSLPYATVVELMDTCRAAGVERIGVLTQKKPDDAG